MNKLSISSSAERLDGIREATLARDITGRVSEHKEVCPSSRPPRLPPALLGSPFWEEVAKCFECKFWGQRDSDLKPCWPVSWDEPLSLLSPSIFSFAQEGR